MWACIVKSWHDRVMHKNEYKFVMNIHIMRACKFELCKWHRLWYHAWEHVSLQVAYLISCMRASGIDMRACDFMHEGMRGLSCENIMLGSDLWLNNKDNPGPWVHLRRWQGWALWDGWIRSDLVSSRERKGQYKPRGTCCFWGLKAPLVPVPRRLGDRSTNES